jgi:hypothetical protein
MSQDRLDRLESLADKILQGLEQTKQQTDSNARAIEALTHQWSEDREQWKQDRKGLYLLLGRLTRSMSDFCEVQSDFYNRFDKIESRQADMTRILQELKENDNKSEDKEE